MQINVTPINNASRFFKVADNSFTRTVQPTSSLQKFAGWFTGNDSTVFDAQPSDRPAYIRVNWDQTIDILAAIEGMHYRAAEGLAIATNRTATKLVERLVDRISAA